MRGGTNTFIAIIFRLKRWTFDHEYILNLTIDSTEFNSCCSAACNFSAVVGDEPIVDVEDGKEGGEAAYGDDVQNTGVGDQV